MSENRQENPIDDLRSQISRMLDSLDQNAPIAAIVLFKVNKAKESSFNENADVLTEATRRLPGVNVFAFHKAMQSGAPAGAIEYLIYEDWESVRLFRVQWDSDHLKRFQNAVGDKLMGPPDLRFYFGWREYRNAESPRDAGNIVSSAFSFSWAMSLFGVQQIANLLSPSKATKAFDDVTQTAEEELSDTLKATFRTGDELQKGIVNRTLGAITGQPSRQSSPNGQQSHQPVSEAAEEVSTQSPRASGHSGTVSGPNGAASVAAAAQLIAEPNISPDFPYAPHYVDVLGSRMHYVEQGTGDPILLLHGNPTWSYIWRNIIPHLSSLGRCIAPDLIGFGRSDKPNIDYHWSDHARYLEAFIATMGLRNITLVLHDQGSGLGFQYTMRHANRVKAIAFFEAIVRPFPWDKFSTPEFREIFRQFRTGGVGGEGWKLIVEQNSFIEQLLPQAAGRPLTQIEMNFYREPFKSPESRVPIWRFPRETPIGGEPKDVWSAVTAYSRNLKRSKLPKLMLYATPGALLTQEHVEWCQQNIKNLQSVYIGPGAHFLQESSPHRIGREIADWSQSLR